MPPNTPKRFQWHDLPCTPYNGERAFSILVPERDTDYDSVLPAIGTLWTSCPAWLKKVEAIPPSLQGYKVRWTQGAGQGGRLFFFGKTLTAQEIKTPYDIGYARRSKYWPTVLHKQWFEKCHFPLATRNASGDIETEERLLDRAKFRDGNEYPTTFIIKRYRSDVPWTANIFKTKVPVTDSIRWNFLSNEGSFPECLHPDVEYPSFQTAGSVMFGAGTIKQDISGELVAQKFPATPMEDWERYCVESLPSEVFGMHFREDVIAVPPIDDREETA